MNNKTPYTSPLPPHKKGAWPHETLDQLCRLSLEIGEHFLPHRNDPRFHPKSVLFSNVALAADALITIEGKHLHGNIIRFSHDTQRFPTPEDTTSQSFLVCQIPNDNNSVGHYWEAIYSHANVIVDLTSPESDALSAYYPSGKDKVKSYHKWNVTEIDSKQSAPNANVVISTYLIEKDGHKKTVARVHYQKWYDFQGESPQNLLALYKSVREMEKEMEMDHINGKLFPNPSLAVHCRASVGRSGTFITIYHLLRLIEQGAVTKENYEDWIHDTILQGKIKRSPEFVQQPSQLEAIYDTIKLVLYN